MKPAPIVFIISRTHGFQSHLLNRQDLFRLARAQNLVGFVDQLMSSDYSSDLGLVPLDRLSAIRLERIFYEKLSNRWFSLLSVSTGRMAQLLEAYNSRLEIENLKRIIRAIHGKDILSDEQLITVPRAFRQVNFAALLAVDTLPAVMDLLKETPYSELSRHLEQYESFRNPIPLETALDKLYYTTLWTRTRRMPDAGRMRALIGTEIDLLNLRLIVARKYMKLDPLFARKSLFDLKHNLSRTTALRLIASEGYEIPSVGLSPSYLELLRRAVELAQENNIVEMENLFSRSLYSYMEKASVRNPTNLAYVLAYLQFCFREARNLTALAIGLQMKMTEPELERLIV